MKNIFNFRKTALTLVLAGLAGSVFAGRPLTVDDANTNDKGAGHVEMWVGRDASKATSLNISPAFAPFDNVEFAGLLSRDTTNKLSLTAVQVKWRITPSNDKGCNFGTVLGTNKVTGGSSGTYVSGNLTCNGSDLGNMNFNLGGTKVSGTSFVQTWGMSLEKEMGSVTPHVEWFGAKGTTPTLQAGLRGEVSKGVQMDGTIGRTAGQTQYTLGTKFQF